MSRQRVFTLEILNWLPESRPYCVGCGCRFTASVDTRCRWDAGQRLLFVYCDDCGAPLAIDVLKRRRKTPVSPSDKLLQDVRDNSSNCKR